jgi:hypothetical protein
VDKSLIKEFGDEITIKTDCKQRLPKKDDYPELIELRQAIFDAAKTTPAFLAAKERMTFLLSQSPTNYVTKSSLN